MGPIAVVESRWWRTGNHSVRQLFAAVAAIHYENPSAFYYDMFADRSSLQTILQARAQDGVSEVIYVASHGDSNCISPTPATAISRTEFRNILKNCNAGGQIKGLFLGTCHTGNTETARFLLQDPGTKLEWVAGYSNAVDWVDGCAIDMVFVSKFTELYLANRGRRKHKLSPRKMAHEAATRLVTLIAAAHTRYGFNIYFHENHKITSMFS